ncbi:Appr-1-p processing protein [Terasakiella brassicae]|uniref:Appr-1-p processing protein n=1 Tax=Terasakiella brassicae TaxID=1634917 RepID=A0A917FET0_9PROT|nr:macro domain-containing protein [Terasakiella brassicae]GGF71020.1 Appr-1-p processing protein [Terasakiella brassicae]
MAIIYTKGDMFKTDADAIVNTVNCVGVMGKGVALTFKNKWPKNFKAYKAECDAKRLRPGKMFIFENGDMLSQERPRYLINFPTKDHWRGKSKMSFIEDGLNDFVAQVQKLEIKTVALPPLGCGNGGLPWKDVKAVIEQKLSAVEGIEFIVYAPKEENLKPEHEEFPSEPMTFERALLIHTMGDFEKYFGGHLTRISLQKIVYFLQEFGFDYNMKFARHNHGPYSERLKDVFKSMERKNFIHGFIDKSESGITVTSGAWAAAEEFFNKADASEAFAKVKKLSLLIEGYESPYGMELLSSVHYLALKEGLKSPAEVVEAMQSWNDHKKSQFAPEAIETAYGRLQEDGFIH